jgi:hypothetical protein
VVQHDVALFHAVANTCFRNRAQINNWGYDRATFYKQSAKCNRIYTKLACDVRGKAQQNTDGTFHDRKTAETVPQTLSIWLRWGCKAPFQ